MTVDDSYEVLSQFFRERRAPKRALAALREGVEIGIQIGGQLECAVFRREDDIYVERREAIHPDFVFSLTPETVIVLAQQTTDDIGNIGLAIFKEMLAGSVQVKMPSGLFWVLRNGYLEVVATGGPAVAAYLAQVGLNSPTRIIRFLKNLGK
jgi:hypothetical protein